MTKKTYRKNKGILEYKTAKGTYKPVKNISTLFKHGMLGKKK